MRPSVFLAALLFAAPSALSQTPFRDALGSTVPDSAQTEILVLGTAHLSALPGLDGGALEPLFDAIERYAPDAILVEQLPARSVAGYAAQALQEPGGVADQIVQRSASLGGVYGPVAQAELGLTAAQARAEADSLDAEPGSPEARRRLALLRLAAYDGLSALVHWTALPASLRGETDPEPIGARYPDWSAADALNFVAATADTEPFTVGVESARRLGIGRVYGFDSEAESEAELRTGYLPRLIEEVAEDPAFLDIQGSGAVAALQDRIQMLAASGDILALYAYMNSEAYFRASAEVEGVWLRTRAPSGLDRARWAMWEVRNLEMAARIRAVSAEHPGGRLLVLVGASHKPYLDALLRTLADVRVGDADAFLGG